MSLVESLIGAIPFEEGAALVARVGERASITAKSGSRQVGSVALTVEAMDDLIAHVLPPDQLESLKENGTVHFEFTPPVIGGEFGVLAASTPGDRWLEIRRKNAATTPRPAPPTDAVRAPAAPAPSPPPASTAADDAEVAARLLARFHAPQALATPKAASPPPLVLVPAPAPAAAPVIDPDFDLSGTIPLRARLSEPPPVPVVTDPAANDDLAIPRNLDFADAKSDFDLDSLSLPDTLPRQAAAGAFETAALPTHSENTNRFQTRPEASGMSTSRFSTYGAPESSGRSRSVVVLSVVLGIVGLAGAGWFAAQRYLWTPPAAVAAPPPPPAPKPKVDPQKAAATSPVAPTTPARKEPAAVAPTPAAASAARPNTEKATPRPGAAAPVARASAPTSAVPHDGFAVQVAAVRERDEADQMVAQLVNKGYPGYLVRGEGAAAAFYRVRVGAFKNRQAAQEAATKLERSEGVKPWIVRETP
jgi:cell division septation protein DedD